MPKTKSPKPAARTNGRVAPEAPKPLPDLQGYADALYRWAAECCRQHDHYAHLLERDALEAEERAWCEIVTICDTTLEQMANGYEQRAASPHHDRDEDWWHRANGLWHATREYLRRHRGCERISRRFEKHSPNHLGALQLEYELEASALLALKHAAEAYRKCCPDCDSQ